MISDSSARCIFEKINKYNLWNKDSYTTELCSFLCASADRLITSIESMNKIEQLDTEDLVLLFLCHCGIIYNVIEGFQKKFKLERKESCILLDWYKESCLFDDAHPEVTDDTLFEYLRSITFAHPTETCRAPFLRSKGAKHYSPWLITNNEIGLLINEPESIGFRLYTNKTDEITDVRFPIELVLRFIESKLLVVDDVLDEIEKINTNFENEAKKRTVVRGDNLIDSLYNIRSELINRYMDTDMVDDLMDYCSCEFVDEKNRQTMSMFATMVEQKIDGLIACLNDLRHEDFYEELASMFSWRIKNTIDQESYYLEKIYSYLNKNTDSSDIQWGLLQLKQYMKGYAKEWIVVDEDMTFTEIKALVTAARYAQFRKEHNDEHNI